MKSEFARLKWGGCMANEEHLAILKKGVSAWNEWRAENPSLKPDLSEAFLARTAFNGVDFDRANLHGADLGGTSLHRAQFYRADLGSANLGGVNLRGATLVRTNLSKARLGAADFEDSVMGSTLLGGVDLSGARGLAEVRHEGPSTIGIDTIYLSKGEIPKVFLRGAGVPQKFIEYMSSLVWGGIEFYSCFISYAAADDEFAARLYRDLDAREVRCWRFPENATWGEPVWGEIDAAVKKYDKLVVVCSGNSLRSGPVLREVERALQREDREKRSVLFPIRIDDYLFDEWNHPRKPDVVKIVAGDFREWKNVPAYEKAVERLVGALNKPQARGGV